MTRANDLSGQQHELPIKCRLDFINEMRSWNMNLFFRERGRINLNLDEKGPRELLENEAMILINVLENQEPEKLERKKIGSRGARCRT